LKIIGFIIVIVYGNSLNYQFSGHGLFMLCLGIVLMCPAIITTGIDYVKK
jgi:hypothetical protein